MKVLLPTVTMFKSLTWLYHFEMVINPCHYGLWGAPDWRTVGVDGLGGLLPPPHPSYCVLQSGPASIQDGKTGEVRKPFHTVPTLELPEDRAWVGHLCPTGPSPEPRTGKVLSKQRWLQPAVLALQLPADQPPYSHSRCFWKLPQILLYHQPQVKDSAGGHHRELVVLIQIRKCYTSWFWFSFLDCSLQTE